MYITILYLRHLRLYLHLNDPHTYLSKWCAYIVNELGSDLRNTSVWASSCHSCTRSTGASSFEEAGNQKYSMYFDLTGEHELCDRHCVLLICCFVFRIVCSVMTSIVLLVWMFISILKLFGRPSVILRFVYCQPFLTALVLLFAQYPHLAAKGSDLCMETIECLLFVCSAMDFMCQNNKIHQALFAPIHNATKKTFVINPSDKSKMMLEKLNQYWSL